VPEATSAPAQDSSATRDHTIKVGSLIAGRYELVARLGYGGMGEVYKALDRLAGDHQDPDPYVAIKILKPELQQEAIAVKALQREANRMLRLTHANIVRTRQFEQDRESGACFIIMELLEGHSLERILAENPFGQPWTRVCGPLEQICAGLKCAHLEGIIHSDIKPSNLFITTRGYVKILDFGIAGRMRSKHADGRETGMDARKHNARSPDYASLEVFLGLEPHYSDDVYSLACVTYEWLSGSHPYASGTRAAVPAPQALAEGLRPARVPGLARSQNRALRSALALRRSDRTQTVAEFWQSMAIPRPAWPGVRIAAVVVGALLIAGSLWGALGLFPQHRAPRPAAPSTATHPVAQQAPAAAPTETPAAAPTGPTNMTARAPPEERPTRRLRRADSRSSSAHSKSSQRESASAQTGPREQSVSAVAAAGQGDAAVAVLPPALEGGRPPLVASLQADLGLKYERGRRGFPQNDAQAVRWYSWAANQGNPRAEAGLGFMYENGRGGLPQSDAEAERWYLLAANQGEPRGQAGLGSLFERGRGGLQQSDAEAVRWYTRAAEQGNAEAEAGLGFMYEHGRGGLQQSESAAARLYTWAAEQGNVRAETRLAYLYEHGRGGLLRNKREALRLYTKAARDGGAEAQAYLKSIGVSW
jgi:TPR repeat protein